MRLVVDLSHLFLYIYLQTRGSTMTSYIEIWENQEAYDYHRNWNGIGKEPDEPKFAWAYDDFKWLEKFITKHNKRWEIWELFQIAAWASRELENENWKGPHPDHDNLKFFEKDSWEMTAIPIGSDYFGICYINK